MSEVAPEIADSVVDFRNRDTRLRTTPAAFGLCETSGVAPAAVALRLHGRTLALILRCRPTSRLCDNVGSRDANLKKLSQDSADAGNELAGGAWHRPFPVEF
jgi:hypothetical protein